MAEMQPRVAVAYIQIGNIIYLDFPRYRHWRVSAVVSKPNSAGSGVPFSRCLKAIENSMNFSVGMAPRAFQLLTADSPTPANPAAADVPPSASMIESTVVSIPPDYSRFVNMSSVHKTAIDYACELAFIFGMEIGAKSVAKRLTTTREALGLSPAELCRQISIAPNRWSQYESGDRRITLAVAAKMCEQFAVTLDWIYRGDPSGLPTRLIQKMRSAA